MTGEEFGFFFPPSVAKAMAGVMELESDLTLGSKGGQMQAPQSQCGWQCRQMVAWRGGKWDWRLCEKPVALDSLGNVEGLVKITQGQSQIHSFIPGELCVKVTAIEGFFKTLHIRIC